MQVLSQQVDTRSHDSMDTSIASGSVGWVAVYVFPANYCAYRKDRNIYGGGVFILVKNNIPSSQVNYDSSNELIWVRIHNNTDADIILGSFYCPPHSPVEILDELAGSLYSNHVSISSSHTWRRL